MRVAGLVFVLLLAGCVTNPGPAFSPNLALHVGSALAGEDVRVYGPANWYQNRRRLAQSASIGAMREGWQEGVAAVTVTGVYFLQWDRQTRSYIITKRFRRAEIESFSLDIHGRSCALVIQDARDLTFHLFEFAEAGGYLNDCAAARRAYEAMSASEPEPVP